MFVMLMIMALDCDYEPTHLYASLRGASSEERSSVQVLYESGKDCRHDGAARRPRHGQRGLCRTDNCLATIQLAQFLPLDQ